MTSRDSTGIQLSETAQKQLKEDPQAFVFVDSDIVDFLPTLKRLTILSLAEANSLYYNALLEENNASCERLFEMAQAKFSEAIDSMPGSSEIVISDVGRG